MAYIGLCARAAVAAFGLLVLAAGPFGAQADRDPDPGVSCLAANVYHEARGESLEGQRAVADVTLNRVADRRWPNTLCEVVWQPYQFSWTHDGLSDATPDSRAYQRAIGVARDAIREGPRMEATHYHAAYTKPYWADKLEYIETIGLHLFYKE